MKHEFAIQDDQGNIIPIASNPELDAVVDRQRKETFYLEHRDMKPEEGLTISDVVRGSKLTSPQDVAAFHRLRKKAISMAIDVYEDRAGSYNVDHEPTEEMVFGCVSLASEIHKRAIRMTGLLTPLRGEEPLKKADLSRLLDTTIDLINYASWQYALLKIAFGDAVGAVEDQDAKDMMAQLSLLEGMR